MGKLNSKEKMFGHSIDKKDKRKLKFTNYLLSEIILKKKNKDNASNMSLSCGVCINCSIISNKNWYSEIEDACEILNGIFPWAYEIKQILDIIKLNPLQMNHLRKIFLLDIKYIMQDKRISFYSQFTEQDNKNEKYDPFVIKNEKQNSDNSINCFKEHEISSISVSFDDEKKKNNTENDSDIYTQTQIDSISQLEKIFPDNEKPSLFRNNSMLLANSTFFHKNSVSSTIFQMKDNNNSTKNYENNVYSEIYNLEKFPKKHNFDYIEKFEENFDLYLNLTNVIEKHILESEIYNVFSAKTAQKFKNPVLFSNVNPLCIIRNQFIKTFTENYSIILNDKDFKFNKDFTFNEHILDDLKYFLITYTISLYKYYHWEGLLKKHFQHFNQQIYVEYLYNFTTCLFFSNIYIYRIIYKAQKQKDQKIIKKFKKNIKDLNEKPISDFGVLHSFCLKNKDSYSPYHETIEHLKKIKLFKSPVHKLQIILGLPDIIKSEIINFYGKNTIYCKVNL